MADVTLHRFVKLPIPKGTRMAWHFAFDTTVRLRRAKPREESNAVTAEDITSRQVLLSIKTGQVFNSQPRD